MTLLRGVARPRDGGGYSSSELPPRERDCPPEGRGLDNERPLVLLLLLRPPEPVPAPLRLVLLPPRDDEDDERLPLLRRDALEPPRAEPLGDEPPRDVLRDEPPLEDDLRDEGPRDDEPRDELPDLRDEP
jgi:hypothetical protein